MYAAFLNPIGFFGLLDVWAPAVPQPKKAVVPAQTSKIEGSKPKLRDIRRKDTCAFTVGDYAEIERTYVLADCHNACELFGDPNEIHRDAEAARKAGFRAPIVQGILVLSMCSAAFGQWFPGSGTVYLEQFGKFKRPVCVGDTALLRVEVSELLLRDGVVSGLKFDCKIKVGDTLVVEGTAKVALPQPA